MKKSNSTIIAKHWKGALTLLFGLAVFLFWGVKYPYALAYQEQWQLFQTTAAYLAERLAQPGGAARYAAEFLVQFYNATTVGALILALLYMLLQRLTWRLMSRATDTWYPLSFIPAVMLWIVMGDESVMLTFAVSLIVTTAAMWLYDGMTLWASRPVRLLFILIAIPLTYWVAGPLVLMLAVYMAIRKTMHARRPLTGVAIGAAAVILAVASILVSAHVVNYAPAWLWKGIDYYRFINISALPLIAIPAAILILAVAARWLPQKTTTNIAIVGAEALLIVGGFLLMKPQAFDSRKYDLMEYDFLVRLNRWDAIIEKATKKQPDLPMSVSSVNLALGMKGQLGDRAFHFFQHGTEGLLPAFQRNFTSDQLTGEIFFQLGLVNTAQRLAFEAMEELPNYNKSCRVVKRLAETNLINGQYDVARKYLKMLGNTFFYEKWAERTEQLLGNEKAINNHPLYGKMRRMRLTGDFLFSDRELDKILGQLLMRDNGNSLAMQYLLLYPLLEGDLDKFMNFMSYTQKISNYNPQSCQEAIVLAYAQHNQQPPQGYVSALVADNFRNFYNTLRSSGKNSPQLNAYKNTVWYYLAK